MANTYCVYVARKSNHDVEPDILQGDTFCVDCPDGSVCEGTRGQPESIRIKDKEGNVSTIRAVLQNSSCTECPDDANKDYTFAPEDNGGKVW